MAIRTGPHEAGEQAEVIAYLTDPQSHGGLAVERIDTHISSVFLAGPLAYKLKRAVRYDFVDFLSLEARRSACEAELRLNRRTAPALYRRVVPITRSPSGALGFGGPGEALDWVVEMQRFEQSALFSALAARQALTPELIDQLADAIAALHAVAEIIEAKGGHAGMARVAQGLDPLPGIGAEALLDPGMAASVAKALKREVERLKPLLEARRARGYVRRCHGDLHLGNVCLFEGRATIFDCIEFNDDFACIDTLYDLSFALMDLWQRGERGLANRLFNRYQGQRFDGRGLAALPLFQSARAAIRTKARALLALSADKPAETTRRAAEEARGYLEAAHGFLARGKPWLVALGGLSGSGKSTVARELAPWLGPSPGALILRSDVLRKELMGASPETRLPEEAYGAETSARVYGLMRERASLALRAGHAVIADAVHAKSEERSSIEAVAAGAGAPFGGFWLEAPPPVLEARLEMRTRDASDATVEVLRQQLAYDLGPIAWQKRDATAMPMETAAFILAALAQSCR